MKGCSKKQKLNSSYCSFYEIDRNIRKLIINKLTKIDLLFFYDAMFPVKNTEFYAVLMESLKNGDLKTVELIFNSKHDMIYKTYLLWN